MEIKPVLIVINGRPASGKSTLGKRLSEDLSVPHLYKDEIKELLFDSLGYGDRDWSTKYNAPSYALINLMAKKILKSGNSVIIESNFSPKFDNENIETIAKETGVRIIQILCTADKEILFERFKERAHLGARHPGHNDDKDLDLAHKRHFTDEFVPLDLPGELVQYDTTKQSEEKYRDLLNKLLLT
jgi:predicted kinase